MQHTPSYHGVAFFLIGMFCLVPIYAFVIIDAFVSARRIGAVTLQRYNRWYLYLATYLFAIIPSLVVEPAVVTYSIGSNSMVPGLLIGDYVYAHSYAYRERPPERGDIAVFKLPTNASRAAKRIVGLPGDSIQIKGGILHINGIAVQRESLGNHAYKAITGREHSVTLYQETLPNGEDHLIVEASDNYSTDNTPLYTVPTKHYFALGDNRDHAADSRYQKAIGFIPHENLMGQIALIYFSQDGSADGLAFWRWPQAIRFKRIGNRVD